MSRAFLLTLAIIVFYSEGANGDDRLRPGARLKAGERLTCDKGLFTLLMQPDGHLVLSFGKAPNGVLVWSKRTTNTDPYLEMQASDGNLVLSGIEDGVRKAAWTSGTSGHPGAFLLCQHDGNLVVRDEAGKEAFWVSGSGREAKAVVKRSESWRAELEEQADQIAQKGDALEARLKEREATYKRRVAAGGLDYGTLQEIEKLKNEIPKIWKELARIEDALAAGPPVSVLAADKPPTKDSPPTVAPATTGAPPPLGGVASGSTPSGSTTLSSGPKTVPVNGYTKQNGTYVAPHMRSSPRR